MFNGTVALVMAVLLGVGPESVLALHQEALLCRAVSPDHVLAVQHHAQLYVGLGAAAIGQPGPDVTAYTYAYDANGNTTSHADGVNTNGYVYDFENRLIGADVEFGGVAGHVDYTYDADGIRTSKTYDAGTAPPGDDICTYYLTDKNRPYAQVLEEWDGPADGSTSAVLTVRYVYGDDLISQTRPGDPAAVTRYYHYDGQLSTRQLTDAAADPAAAAVTDTYTFDAFGNLLASTGSTANPYLYTGEQYDPNVSFYYLRARYYAQAIGRFIGLDTFRGSSFEPLSLHKYLYVHADPIDNRDPTGKSISLVQVMAVGALIGALTGALVYLGLTAPGQRTWRGYLGAILLGAGIGAALAYGGWYAALHLGPQVMAIYLGVLYHVSRTLSTRWTSVQNLVAHYVKRGHEIARILQAQVYTASQYASDAIWTVENGYAFTNVTGQRVFVHFMANDPRSGHAIFAYVVVNPANQIITFIAMNWHNLRRLVPGIEG